MLIEERSQNAQSRRDIFSSHADPARDTTTNAQMKSDKDTPMPIQTRPTATTAAGSVSCGQSKSTTKASPSPRTDHHDAADADVPFSHTPAAGIRDYRASKRSNRPAKASAAAAKAGQSPDRPAHVQPVAQPLNKTALVCGGEAEEDREVSDDGDMLEDVIRDPVTLEVRRSPPPHLAKQRGHNQPRCNLKPSEHGRDLQCTAGGHGGRG
jgi:hypothetical protein